MLLDSVFDVHSMPKRAYHTDETLHDSIARTLQTRMKHNNIVSTDYGLSDFLHKTRMWAIVAWPYRVPKVILEHFRSSEQAACR